MKSLKISKPIYATVIAAVCCIAAPGCHSLNKTQRGALIGAGTGSIVGGFIGKAAGNTALGAIIGGALGGTAGAFVGKNMDKQASELTQTVPDATVTREGEGIIVKFNSGILFDVGKTDIKPGAQTNLQNLSASLKKNPQTIILIIGHTDNSGTETANSDLSLQRAEAVKMYLSKNGIAAARVTTQGKGDTEPIADNKTPEGRAQNRRVEIVILASDEMKKEARQSGK